MRPRTIGRMKRGAMVLVSAFLSVTLNNPLPAQTAPVTVPVTLDHNRIVIDLYVPLSDGTSKRVRGLIDTSQSDLEISLRVQQLLNKNLNCETGWCKGSGPSHVTIGGLSISLNPMATTYFPARPTSFNDLLIPGMSPEVIPPASVWKNFDLVVDYANRQLTIGPPGSVKFAGTRIPIRVDANGVVTVSGKVDGRTYNFGIDTGMSTTVARTEQVAEWHKKHPSWPSAAGALGAANMTGDPEELHGEMLRVPAIELGSITLRDVLISSGEAMPKSLAKDSTVIGVLGGETFKGARIGIDYAHSNLYIEQIGNPPTAAGLDVVGLTLRPEVNGQYKVIAVVPYENQPSIADVRAGDILVGVDGAPVMGATMGQVWSLLTGEPGQVRKLILERDGKRMTEDATVRRFLGQK
jgi:Aspartyl protease